MTEKRKRPTPRRVRVEKIEQLTPRVLSIVFQGDDLSGVTEPKPGGHIKLLFADDTAFENPSRLFEPDRPRPTARTYTPRRFDPSAGTLEVEFILHGGGVASRWAENAKIGDRLLLAGPGGGYEISLDLSHLVIAADSCALPAAGTLLDALPASVTTTLLFEVENAAEERIISDRAESVHWLHEDTAAPSERLVQAVADLSISNPETGFWVACEAQAVRRIRSSLLTEREVPKPRIHTRGYWFIGATDYPDGDYGEGDPKIRPASGI